MGTFFIRCLLRKIKLERMFPVSHILGHWYKKDWSVFLQGTHTEGYVLSAVDLCVKMVCFVNRKIFFSVLKVDNLNY